MNWYCESEHMFTGTYWNISWCSRDSVINITIRHVTCSSNIGRQIRTLAVGWVQEYYCRVRDIGSSYLHNGTSPTPAITYFNCVVVQVFKLPVILAIIIPANITKPILVVHTFNIYMHNIDDHKKIIKTATDNVNDGSIVNFTMISSMPGYKIDYSYYDKHIMYLM